MVIFSEPAYSVKRLSLFLKINPSRLLNWDTRTSFGWVNSSSSTAVRRLSSHHYEDKLSFPDSHFLLMDHLTQRELFCMCLPSLRRSWYFILGILRGVRRDSGKMKSGILAPGKVLDRRWSHQRWNSFRLFHQSQTGKMWKRNFVLMLW